MNTSRVMIPALLAAALIGGTMTSDAFAGPHHRGQGNGYGPCYGYGDGGCWEGGWGHHGHARGWGYRAMSDAQRAKFDKIMEEFAPRMEQHLRQAPGTAGFGKRHQPRCEGRA